MFKRYLKTEFIKIWQFLSEGGEREYNNCWQLFCLNSLHLCWYIQYNNGVIFKLHTSWYPLAQSYIINIKFNAKNFKTKKVLLLMSYSLTLNIKMGGNLISNPSAHIIDLLCAKNECFLPFWPFIWGSCTVISLAPICSSFISPMMSEPILRQSPTARKRNTHSKEYSVPFLGPSWQIL